MTVYSLVLSIGVFVKFIDKFFYILVQCDNADAIVKVQYLRRIHLQRKEVQQS